jgi:RNA polymerase sigma-70 factor (ECF subfamily)
LTTVIRSAMDGDKPAFESLMRAHVDYILTCVRNLVSDEQDAEEVTQDILVIVYHGIGKLSNPYAFSSWLRMIVVNTCLKYEPRARHKTARRASGEKASRRAVADDPRMPDEAVEELDLREKLSDLIRELPQSQRTLIFLYYYEELTYKEIARLLGIRIGSVSSGIRKAKNNLKKAIDKSKNFDAEGRLIEGVAFGSLVKEAIEYDSGKFIARSAVEKIYAKIATADTLPISSTGQTVHVASGSSSAKAAWIAGGATAAVCAALLLWQHPTPMPVQEQGAPAPAQSVTKDVRYKADAAVISFVTDSPLGDAVDPVGASIAVNDDEGTATAWTVKDEGGAGIADGDGAEADIPSLSPGRYVISWDVVGDSGAVSVVSREFFVN